MGPIRKNFNIDNLPKEVNDHLRGEYGTRIKFRIGNIVHEYIHDDDFFLAERFARKIKAEKAWFESIIKHQPSVGQFYENLLKNTLREFAPTKLNVGTGFILDSLKKKHSQQLDIIVYQEYDKACIYKSGDFVIVSSEQIVSIAEVKKTLVGQDIKNLVRKNILFNNGTHPNQYNNIQVVNLFAFETKLSTQRICTLIIDTIEEMIQNFRFFNSEKNSIDQYPILSLTLPNIFFSNRKEYIETSMKIDGMYFFLEVNIRGTSSKENDSIGEFLLRSIGLSFDISDFSNRNFINTPLVIAPNNYKPKKTSNFKLYDRLSLLDVSRFYKQDFISTPIFLDDDMPHKFYIEKGMNWKSFSRLEDLLRTGRVIVE